MALSENYFKSRDVRVFPSSFRGTYDNTTTFDPEARLNTEANFIAPKIAGNKASYIVNYTTNTINSKKFITAIKFVLGGYYFEINNLNDYNLSDKYLNIKLRDVKIAENQDDDNKDSERKTSLLDTWEDNNGHILDSLDSEANISYFSGLKISSISPEKNAYASIKLLVTKGDNNVLNQEAILVDLDHGTGENTLLHGEGLNAKSKNQVVFGTYNDNKEDTLFEIGKGTEGITENALEVSTTTTNINNPTINLTGENITITGESLVHIDSATKIDGTTNIWGALGVHSEAESTTKNQGAIVVAGGVGVGKNLNVGGDANLGNKLEIKKTPTDTETNVKVDGTLNVTGKTYIYSNITIDSNKTTLAKPVEITDDSDDALKVKGKTTIEKDLEIGGDTKVLNVKNSPAEGEQNVTITGTLKSTGKATFGDELEVASGKTTTLGGQVDITGAVNINTSNQDNPEEITIYGDTYIYSNLTIADEKKTTLGGDLEVKGATTLKDTLTIADGKITTLGGNLEVKGTTILKDNLTVSDEKSTTLGGSLEVKGTTTLKDNLTVSDAKSTTLGGTLTVNKATALNGVLTVKDTTILNGTLTVADEKTTTLGGDLKIKKGLIVADNTTLGGDLEVKGNVYVGSHSLITSDITNIIWTGTVSVEQGKNELDLTSLNNTGITDLDRVISVQATIKSNDIPPNREVYNMLVFAANWIHHDFYLPLTVYAEVDSTNPKKVNIYANRKCDIYLTAYCKTY